MLHLRPDPAVAALRRAAADAAFLSLGRALLALWAAAGRRMRGRALLARLDDRMLKDAGLSRADAWAEARKPFWRA
ncbi:hypothetical protein A6A04_18670 [Paramagnetospirillum marisnigri]|uniref:YjiS-like domain-containing protein n=1 Tax=Paramagnetospirillum marisnigri TaxID=1285242 RepID=A0A178MP11_9PROT|nr:DUF1127 domain-containing protein [Paramagnetospirillum marisnigri]OAN49868.1 hypothetical protein A6A04_18670 [Paramagnetospirillum marisnigri]